MQIRNLTACLFVTFILCMLQSPAFADINISDVTSTGFTVSYSNVIDATRYEVTVSARHDTTYTTTLTTAGTSANFALRSNINYKVSVRGLDINNASISYSWTTARTAPSGSSILQVITTPTFITVFLEETPGSTSWQIEYNNTIIGVSNTIDVPAGVPSNTYYVAILTSLSPNTRYTLRARVSQINSDTNYTEAQSPFGKMVTVSTDKVSAFGRTTLLTKTYSSTAKNNVSLKREIAAELQAEYQALSSDVFSVSVTELENDGSGNIRCHHEIVFNNRTEQPDVSALVLNDATLYENSKVRFGVGKDVLYRQDDNQGAILYPYTRCVYTGDPIAKRLWSLFSKQENTSAILPPTVDNSAGSLQWFDFTNSGITVRGGNKIFNLSPNNIYGIKQNYLLKTCPSDDSSTVMYDRVHGSMGSGSVGSDKHTIFRTTGVTFIPTDRISYVINANGTGVTLKIPSDVIGRAVLYSFSVDRVVKATLSEDELDGSTTYMVDIGDLTQDARTRVTIEATARGHDNRRTAANATFDVTTACEDGFSRHGRGCEDVDECKDAIDACPPYSTCSNTPGNYTCICDYASSTNACNPCNARTDEELCSNCNVDASCVQIRDGSFFYNCSCEVDRDNPCGGLSASVSCDIDFCDGADLCKNHKNTICTKNGKILHECECIVGYGSSSVTNLCEALSSLPSTGSLPTPTILIPILIGLVVVVAGIISASVYYRKQKITKGFYSLQVAWKQPGIVAVHRPTEKKNEIFPDLHNFATCNQAEQDRSISDEGEACDSHL